MLISKNKKPFPKKTAPKAPQMIFFSFFLITKTQNKSWTH